MLKIENINKYSNYLIISYIDELCYQYRRTSNYEYIENLKYILKLINYIYYNQYNLLYYDDIKSPSYVYHNQIIYKYFDDSLIFNNHIVNDMTIDKILPCHFNTAKNAINKPLIKFLIDKMKENTKYVFQ